MWGGLSDERTGLSITIAVGSCQRSHSRIRVPWDWWLLLSQIQDFLFVASYDSQGYGGGIRPRLHTEGSVLLRLSGVMSQYFKFIIR
jgi:hypothetical protein